MSTGLGTSAALQGSSGVKSRPCVRIGAWKADPNLDEISCGAKLVKLEPRAMRLLLYLAANRNRVVALSEMLDAIWPNVVVTPQSVYSTIAQLRQMLGDSAESPIYIATVPRKGYRLIAEVADCSDTEPAPTSAAMSLDVPPPAATADIPPASSVQIPPAASVEAPALAGSVTVGPMAAGRPVTARFWAMAVVLAVAALAAFYYLPRHRPAPPAPASVPSASSETPAPVPASLPASVAVLPFLDLSEKKGFEYFSDGLTEELIDLLAHNSSLRVPARTSSFYFKGKAAPVAGIAQQLNVAYLLEGSVRRSGKTVRITAQLIRAVDGYHLWSETYDRDDSDDLTVEDDIAGKVVETLRAKLTPRAASGVPGTLDVAARNLFMECQFYVTRNTAVDTLKSVDCFQRVIAANPQSAHAWAAYALALLRKPNLVEEPEAQRRNDNLAAANAARHALQLDPDAADAHAALANYLMSNAFDWDAARQELHAALKSDPNDPPALLAEVRLAEILGRSDEVISLCVLVRDRDPLNFLPYARLWVAYMRVGRYQDAEAAARRRLDLSPEGSGGHADLALTLLMQNRAEEALAENARESGPRARLLVDGAIYHALGHHTEADAAFKELLQAYGSTDPMYVAQLSAYRGDNDRAFEALNAGVSAGSLQVYLVKIDFLFNGLRADPRYHLLLRRMHLPD